MPNAGEKKTRTEEEIVLFLTFKSDKSNQEHVI